MKAYAVLDGGGVKGAALAGCLDAAASAGVEFHGYGGTSAGSIVALLAAVGYSGTDLRHIMTEEVNFEEFLDGAGTQVSQLKEVLTSLRERGAIGKALAAFKGRSVLGLLVNDLGLTDAKRLTEYLNDKVVQKLPQLAGRDHITFDNLVECGCPPLKVLASDLRTRSPVVYSARSEFGSTPVVDAVRASASYPFVFKPFVSRNRSLVDGGLSSNLPVFLFEEERRRTRYPVLAFDLVPSAVPVAGPYDFGRLVADLLGLALESSEHLIQGITPGVYRVSVPTPPAIGTLDFDLSEDDRVQLFVHGQAAAYNFFARELPQWAQAETIVERLQARYTAPPAYVVETLRAFAREIEQVSNAEDVRANIMLPTENDTRIVAYQYGMNAHPDADLELTMDGGCSGKAWSTRSPAVADLVRAQENYSNEWGMTSEQQRRVESNRKAMFSVPMFDLRTHPRAQSVQDVELFGVLSVDSTTPLDQTGWLQEDPPILKTARLWADILSRFIP